MPEGLRVRELVCRDENRAHGAEGVERLALEPLIVALLEIARGHVIDHGVAEDVFEGFVERDVPPAGADHHRQLDLVVELLGHRVVDHVVARPDHRRAGLGEVDGVLRHGGAALGGVVGVVAAEAEDVPGGRRDGSQKANALEGIGEPALGQLLDGLLIRQPLAVLPSLARDIERRLTALDQLQHGAGEAAAPPPDGAALRGQLLGEAGQVQHALVPRGSELGLTTAATERDEVHGCA